MPTRRCLLATAGRTLQTLAATPAAAETLASVPAAALPDPLAPWHTAPASTHPDWRVRAAAWAVLAPNPHNRQPWLVQLAADGDALLRCDLDRRLPATDPVDRQITIGLGCFAELFRMAAAANGVRVAVEPFPQGTPDGRLDGRPVARLRRLPGVAVPDPLFAAVPHRRSAKLPFDPAQPVGADRLARIAAALGPDAGFAATEAAGPVAALRALTWEAWMIEATTPPAHLESVDLMRLGRAAVAAQPDGIAVWGPAIEPLIERGVLTRDAFAAPGRPGYQAMLDRYRPMLAATNAYVWTTSAADDHLAALAAGRHWLRLNLAATLQGLALHPVSQALQEYPAMAAARAALHRLLGVAAPARVQMLGRLGVLPVGTLAPETPRWPAESRMLDG